MKSQFLQYRSSRIHYQLTGRGPKLLCCFHGYGESGDSFSFLEQPLQHIFTLLMIDMPFHGQTDWKEGLNFRPAELLEILQQIVEKERLDFSSLRILGYSMGARISLSLVELIPDRIKHLLLIAPDGLSMGGWYRFATQSQPGNRFFRFTMNSPGWFMGLLKLSQSLKLVNPSVHKFASSYMSDSASRAVLYQRWTCLRHFKPDTSKTRDLIKSHQIRTELLYGRFDRMIRHQTGADFIKGINGFGQLTILPSGHQLLQPKNLDLIISLL